MDMQITIGVFTGLLMLFAMIDTFGSNSPRWAPWVAVIAGLIAMAAVS